MKRKTKSKSPGPPLVRKGHINEMTDRELYSRPLGWCEQAKAGDHSLWDPLVYPRPQFMNYLRGWLKRNPDTGLTFTLTRVEVKGFKMLRLDVAKATDDR